MWGNVLKTVSSEIYGRQPLKNFKADHITSNFLKAVFHIFHLLHF